jgi:hypothetical protein
MNTLFRAHFLALILVISGCATPLETVVVPTDPTGWKLGYASDRRGQTIAIYVPREESMDSWTRQFTIQFTDGVRTPPLEWMTNLESLMQKRCPGSYWKLIEQDSNSVLYEWKISNCAGHANQHEVARLLKGNDGIHRIAYVEKNQNIASTVREKWIKSFLEAYVDKNGKRIVVAP